MGPGLNPCFFLLDQGDCIAFKLNYSQPIVTHFKYINMYMLLDLLAKICAIVFSHFCDSYTPASLHSLEQPFSPRVLWDHEVPPEVTKDSLSCDWLTSHFMIPAQFRV